jgi:integrase
LRSSSRAWYHRRRSGTSAPAAEVKIVTRAKYCRRPGRGGRYVVYLYWASKKHSRYSYTDRTPLLTTQQCDRLCALINADLERRQDRFDVGKWFGSAARRSLEFQDYAREWLRRQEYAPSWQVSVEHYLYDYMIPHFGGREIPTITGRDLHEFYRQFPRKLGPKSKKNIMGVLHKIFSDALRLEDIDRLPPWPRVTAQESEVKWLDPETQDRVLAAIPEEDRPVFELLAEYGLRPSEVRALFWDCVDFRRGQITIKRSYSLDTLREVTKTKLIRVLPITARGREILEARPREGDHVFPNPRTGKRYGRMDLYRIWRKAADAVGVACDLYQGTRHTRATNLVNSGVPLQVVQKLLGHTRSDMTQRYARLTTDTLREALEQVPLAHGFLGKNRCQAALST